MFTPTVTGSIRFRPGLTTVTGPAGSGKTFVLLEWVRDNGADHPVLWVDADGCCPPPELVPGARENIKVMLEDHDCAVISEALPSLPRGGVMVVDSVGHVGYRRHPDNDVGRWLRRLGDEAEAAGIMLIVTNSQRYAIGSKGVVTVTELEGSEPDLISP
jgi:hypothetical protein